MMPALVVAASLMLAHITGFIEVIAPPLGALGTVISTVDKSAVEVVNVRKYLAARHVKKVTKR